MLILQFIALLRRAPAFCFLAALWIAAFYRACAPLVSRARALFLLDLHICLPYDPSNVRDADAGRWNQVKPACAAPMSVLFASPHRTLLAAVTRHVLISSACDQSVYPRFTFCLSTSPRAITRYPRLGDGRVACACARSQRRVRGTCRTFAQVCARRCNLKFSSLSCAACTR